jgi:hypothetical protein
MPPGRHKGNAAAPGADRAHWGSKMEKKCEDCRHRRDHGIICCTAPKAQEADTLWQSASLQRRDGWLMSRLRGTCGTAGRFFELKPVRLVRADGKAA